MTLDQATAAAMAVLFAATLIANIAAWVIDGNWPALGRCLMAAGGLVLYVLLLLDNDLWLALRLAFAFYVIPHLLVGADMVIDKIKDRWQ